MMATCARNMLTELAMDFHHSYWKQFVGYSERLRVEIDLEATSASMHRSTASHHAAITQKKFS